MARSSIDVRLEGGEAAARVARELRRLGDKDIRRDLNRALTRATVPMRVAAKASAKARLPRRGGLGRDVAAKRMRTVIAGGGVSVNVGTRREQLRLMDEKGIVRHPVFGNRSAWVTQEVHRGWFTEPMNAGAPVARRELLGVLDRVAARIAARTNTT